MATQEEKIAIVQRGVDEFAALEKGLEDAKERLQALSVVFKDAYGAEMMPQGQMLKITNRLDRLYGRAADILADVLEIHEAGTKIAKANDADVSLPTNYAATGGVVVMGGGR